MKIVIWLLVVIMFIFHQDNWNWENDTIVLGFMPMGLFFHACLSLVAGVVWWLACIYAWPEGVDEFDEPTAKEGGEV